MKYAATILLALAITVPAGAQGLSRLVRFDGGIGVLPVSGPVLPVNQDGTFQNVTRRIWSEYFLKIANNRAYCSAWRARISGGH